MALVGDGEFDRYEGFRLQCMIASTIAISLSGIDRYVRRHSYIEVFR